MRRFLPSCAFISPRRIVTRTARSSSAGMSSSRNTCWLLRRASRTASAASTTCCAGTWNRRLALRFASFSSARMRAACFRISAAGWPRRCSIRRISTCSASSSRCASFSLSTSVVTCLAPSCVSRSTSRTAALMASSRLSIRSRRALEVLALALSATSFSRSPTSRLRRPTWRRKISARLSSFPSAGSLSGSSSLKTCRTSSSPRLSLSARFIT